MKKAAADRQREAFPEETSQLIMKLQQQHIYEAFSLTMTALAVLLVPVFLPSWFQSEHGQSLVDMGRAA